MVLLAVAVSVSVSVSVSFSSVQFRLVFLKEESVYLPGHFSVEETLLVMRIVQDFPFATVISFDAANEPFINHLPLLVEKDDLGLRLVGHMAKRNPQWQHFAAGSKVIIVFNGPQAYITPSWYVSGRDVPTWNYVVVHAEGKAKTVEDFEGLVSILEKLTDRFEKGTPQPWRFELPQDLMDRTALTAAIVGFEIRVEKLKAKFKLSQNRSTEDKQGVLEGLSKRTDEMSHQILTLMKDPKLNRN